MSHIKIIIGSTRPGRFGVQPAQWIMEQTKNIPEATFELVDLGQLNLPLLDESVPPAMANGNYQNEHTEQWSTIVSGADGFVFVTPEYNHGVPAALKNAIDFLSSEWYYKPVSFVSYGVHGGGIRAVEHLRGITGWLRMYDMHDELALRDYFGQLDENGSFQPTDQQDQDAQRLLKNLVFWADTMAPARKKLLEK